MSESTISSGTTTDESAVRRARTLLQMPVYTIADGKHIGVIDTLLVRREDRSIPWLRIRTGTLGGYAFLPYAAFHTIGVDIALIPSGAELQSSLPSEQTGVLDSGLTGRSVLTHGGEHVGHLVGLEIDTTSGQIAAFLIRPEAGFLRNLFAAVRDKTVSVPVAAVTSLGPDAIILNADALTLFRSENNDSDAAATLPVSTAE